MPKTVNSTERRRSSLYRPMVSIKTSLVFLGIFALLFFIGTIFPQSSDPDRLERYRAAGGKLVEVVGALDLLNIFHTWYFAALSGLFTLHLLLCSIERLGALRKRPKFALFTKDDLLKRDHSFSIACPANERTHEIENILRSLGFRRVRYYSEDSSITRVIVEKGLPFRWLSWLYHLCILASIIGFLLTYLYAFEGELTIPVGERKTVSLASSSGVLRALHPHFKDEKPRPDQIEVELVDFITEYTEKPVLHYSDTLRNRFFAAWGLAGKSITYSLSRNSLYPRDWFSILRVYRNGTLVKTKKIEVNDPLRYAGHTFYQIGYDYQFNLKVGEETLSDIQANAPFSIPAIEGDLRLRTPKVGVLFRYDGRLQILSPSATLEYRPPREPRTWSTVAELRLNQPKEVMQTQLTMTGFRESSVLSYRYDPGVPLLWIATAALMILMTLRLYVPWYQVRCHSETSNGRTLVTAGIRMVGLFARPDRIMQKLSDELQK
ncbi:MAG: cytochrome c biogenesis protein ResB [Candidatus Abyssubacteria bacterium]